MRTSTWLGVLVGVSWGSPAFADILVADLQNRRVMRFDQQDGSFIEPAYIQMQDPDGLPFDMTRVGDEVWVTDPVFGQVVRYSLDGEMRLGQITGFDGATFGLEYVPQENAVFVAVGLGTNNPDKICRVSVASGSITDSFSVLGALDVVRSGGSLLMTDEDTDLIYRYSYDGTYLEEFADVRDDAGFRLPYQFTKSAEGSIVVGCAGFGISDTGVVAYAQDGPILDAWPTSDGIIGIAALDNGNFLVTLNNAGTVAVFDPAAGSLTPVGPNDVLCFFAGRAVVPAPGPASLVLLIAQPVLARRRR